MLEVPLRSVSHRKQASALSPQYGLNSRAASYEAMRRYLDRRPRYRRVVRGTAAAGTVRVRAGDNASSIARRYGVSLGALLNYNGLTLGSVLRPGDIIKIPGR